MRDDCANTMFRNLDRSFGESSFLRQLDEAYDRALGDLNDEIINEDSFVDLYSDRTVEDDKAYVERMEKKFQEQNSPEVERAIQMGTIFEAIIHEQVELNDWLGEDVTTRKASRFDDIKNGVDTIAEIEHETSTSHLALAFDVTYGKHVVNKIERIKREIEQGTLTEVKYFESSDETIKGKLSKVPRVVVGADKETLKELTDLWMNRKNKDLAVHPIQLQIIDEIVMQLGTYRDYAIKVGQGDIAQIYDRQLSLIKKIQESKQDLYESSDIGNGYLANDRVFAALTDVLRDFES